jgi:putative ABC transport system permease protein
MLRTVDCGPWTLITQTILMISNYFKIAIRSLLKFKGYASINLIGLALGLTAGIMIMLYVMDELSYDNFHTKADRVYRVESQFISDKSFDNEGTMETNAWGVGYMLRKDYPEVEAVLYTRNAPLLVSYEGKRIRERIHFASPEFFDIFTFPLKKGNAKKALTDPYSVVITEEMERKYFNGQDALNKTLVMADTMQFVVTGVMASIPSNSHIQLDMLVSFSTFTSVIYPEFDYNGGWGNINMRNYVLLKEGADVNAFKAKAKGIYTTRAAGMLKDWGVQGYVVFAPLDKLYLTAKANGLGPLGSIDRIYLVSGIAVFVILLACINFINLTTARSVYRAKEVGLRKVVGSTREGLIRQFLSESFVLTLMALAIAIAFTGLLLPLFNQLLAKGYSLTSLIQPSVISGILGLIVAVTILSGYYPALVMSAMRPAEVLKGKTQAGVRGGQLRRALVVFQFVISVSLVLGTLVVLNQLSYMQQQELGFAKDEIFVVNAARARAADPTGFETFKEELKSLAIVEDVTFTNSVPGNPGWVGQISYPEGRSGDETVSVEYMAIDDHYIKTIGLQLIAGRNFDQQREAELKDGLILNETAVSMFGWASPEEAIGKKITSPSGFPAGEVIGVVKDYHQLGLQREIGPMAMDYFPRNSYLYAVRYKAANTQQLITQVNDLWQKHFPGNDFNYFFLDQDFERQYQSEARLARVFGLFATITVVIAVIGLLGLVSFMVAARTKEIGVRKVLGADVLHITSLLSKEFLMLVVIANVIAFPVAWYFADQWLQQFANRVDVNPLVFVATLLIAVTITLATISIQTVKAAMADPVKSLRYE